MKEFSSLLIDSQLKDFLVNRLIYYNGYLQARGFSWNGVCSDLLSIQARNKLRHCVISGRHIAVSTGPLFTFKISPEPLVLDAHINIHTKKTYDYKH